MHVYLFLTLLGWMILFNTLRCLFFVFNSAILPTGSRLITTILESAYYAIPLDLAMASYLLVVPWLMLSVGLNRRNKWDLLTLDCYYLVMAGTYSLIAIANMAVYPEWKTNLNLKALTVFAHPSEILHITTWWQLTLILVTIILITAWSFFGFQALRHKWIKPTPPCLRHRLALLPWLLILGVGARGGLKAIPINASRVYFSKDATINDGTTNPGWYTANMIFGLHALGNGKNPFEFYPRQDALANLGLMTPTLSTEPQSTKKFIKNSRPNIAFIVLESWSADLIESLGGLKGLTPEFHALEKDGLLFTNFFANGNRSQQGIASIFKGYPALPLVTVSTDPSKVRQLPQFANSLNKIGYHTSFIYGAQLEYGNIKAILMADGFQDIREEHQMPADLPRGEMGIHDGYMYDQFLSHIDQIASKPQPFLTSFFTLSTHAPYDTPDRKLFQFDGLASDYIRSAMYADRELGRFFAMAKTKPWYQNTLFVVVADHSHNTYRNWPTWHPEYRRIPFMMLGGAIKDQFRGQIIDQVASQVDIVATLFGQMNLDSRAFIWSKDILDRTSAQFAFYEFNEGVGMVNREGALAYSHQSQRVLHTTLPQAKLQQDIRFALSYVQVLFQNYLDL